MKSLRAFMFLLSWWEILQCQLSEVFQLTSKQLLCSQGFESSSDRPHVWRLLPDDLGWWTHTPNGGRPSGVHQNQSQTQVRRSTLTTYRHKNYIRLKVLLSRSTSLKWDNVKKELENFASMARSCKGGRITLDEFARFLKLPVTQALEELFALFDRVRTNIFFTFGDKISRKITISQCSSKISCISDKCLEITYCPFDSSRMEMEPLISGNTSSVWPFCVDQLTLKIF